MSAGRGPAIALIGPKDRHDTDLDASLRIISIYDPPTDGVITRLDVLLNYSSAGEPFKHGMVGDQVNVAVRTSSPGNADLWVPKNGLLGSYALKANAEDLSAALRALADAIDSIAKRPQP